jgi:hypothetical protein
MRIEGGGDKAPLSRSADAKWGRAPGAPLPHTTHVGCHLAKEVVVVRAWPRRGLPCPLARRARSGETGGVAV